MHPSATVTRPRAEDQRAAGAIVKGGKRRSGKDVDPGMRPG